MLTAHAPDFETIHAPHHYQNMFYNPDLKAYVAFSFAHIQRHFLEQESVRPLDAFPDAKDGHFPSLYHIHVNEHRAVRVPGLGQAYTQAVTIIEGASFVNIADGSALLLTRDEIDRRQQCGLLFDENRDIMFHGPYEERWADLVDDMHEHITPQEYEHGQKALWRLPSLK